MIKAQSSIVIERPAEAVFEFIGPGFFHNYPRWSPEVVSLSQTSRGPVGTGTTGRQVRKDHGRRTECSFRVVAYTPNRSLAFQSTSRPRFRVSYELHPVEQGTRLTFAFELRTDLVMRPFEGMIRDAVDRGARRVCANLRQLLEIDADASSRLPGRVAAAAPGG
jgi:hypothetical protein